MLGALSVFAQTAPKFEVASIKPSDPATRGFRIQTAPGGRYIASGVTLKFLIQQAYGMREFQVLGGPGWADSLRFDINAKADEETAEQQNVFSQRMQALLADRFQLKFTREKREMPIYHLVVAKAGPKMKESTVAEEGRNMRTGRDRMFMQGITMSMFAVQLSQNLGRVVIDKTELAKIYDFSVQWTPDSSQPLGPKDGEAAPAADGPTLFTALQEQLGLKLESAKGPVEVLIIERVEKPTEN